MATKGKRKPSGATMDAVRREADAMAELAAGPAASAPAGAASILPDDAPITLTELVVDALAAAAEGCRSEQLAPALSVDVQTLRAELMELEEAGMVHRTGRTRGTRWHLA